MLRIDSRSFVLWNLVLNIALLITSVYFGNTVIGVTDALSLCVCVIGLVFVVYLPSTEVAVELFLLGQMVASAVAYHIVAGGFQHDSVVVGVFLMVPALLPTITSTANIVLMRCLAVFEGSLLIGLWWAEQYFLPSVATPGTTTHHLIRSVFVGIMWFDLSCSSQERQRNAGSVDTRKHQPRLFCKFETKLTLIHALMCVEASVLKTLVDNVLHPVFFPSEQWGAGSLGNLHEAVRCSCDAASSISAWLQKPLLVQHSVPHWILVPGSESLCQILVRLFVVCAIGRLDVEVSASTDVRLESVELSVQAKAGAGTSDNTELESEFIGWLGHLRQSLFKISVVSTLSDSRNLAIHLLIPLANLDSSQTSRLDAAEKLFSSSLPKMDSDPLVKALTATQDWFIHRRRPNVLLVHQSFNEQEMTKVVGQWERHGFHVAGSLGGIDAVRTGLWDVSGPVDVAVALSPVFTQEQPHMSVEQPGASSRKKSYVSRHRKDSRQPEEPTQYLMEDQSAESDDNTTQTISIDISPPTSSESSVPHCLEVLARHRSQHWPNCHILYLAPAIPGVVNLANDHLKPDLDAVLPNPPDEIHVLRLVQKWFGLGTVLSETPSDAESVHKGHPGADEDRRFRRSSLGAASTTRSPLESPLGEIIPTSHSTSSLYSPGPTPRGDALYREMIRERKKSDPRKTRIHSHLRHDHFLLDDVTVVAGGDEESATHQSPLPQPHPATDLNFHWTKGKLLGSGALGVVHIGMNDSTGELFAVKTVSFDRHDKEIAQKLRNLQTEISVMKSLRHTNIVGYIGAQRATDSPTIHILMEYVPGGSISHLLSAFGPFSDEVMSTYTAQILDGLQYLHENDVLHRDIKCANILISIDGVVKLADFGSAAIISDLKNSPGTQGTPYWMAPEILKGESAGIPADIWSVGCAVMEMATAKHPFAHTGFAGPRILQMICDSSQPLLYNPGPSVSRCAIKFIQACLHRTPEFRPSIERLRRHPFISLAIPVERDALLEFYNIWNRFLEEEDPKCTITDRFMQWHSRQPDLQNGPPSPASSIASSSFHTASFVCYPTSTTTLGPTPSGHNPLIRNYSTLILPALNPRDPETTTTTTVTMMTHGTIPLPAVSSLPVGEEAESTDANPIEPTSASVRPLRRVAGSAKTMTNLRSVAGASAVGPAPQCVHPPTGLPPTHPSISQVVHVPVPTLSSSPSIALYRAFIDYHHPAAIVPATTVTTGTPHEMSVHSPELGESSGDISGSHESGQSSSSEERPWQTREEQRDVFYDIDIEKEEAAATEAVNQVSNKSSQF